MDRIRLLHLITRLPIGGAERMLVAVLRNLDAAQFESTVCCIQDLGELAAEVEALGIPVISLQLMDKHGFDRRVTPALRKLIRDRQIDVVHSHLYHANLYGRLAARREGVPAIASVHNTYTRRKWYRHLINRYLGRHCFRVTAGSEDVEKDLLEVDRLPPEKVSRLPNCIDLTRVATELSPEQAKLRLGFGTDDLVIATVGRAEEQKGHSLLLEAFARLRESSPLQPRLKLLVVGDGRLLPELRETARRLGIEDACRLPGNIPALADVYRGVDIFIMPSLWEGLSLAMLEAMAAGLPMIATEVGGAREVLGVNRWGLLIPPRNVDAIVTAVTELLDDELRRKAMAFAGQQRVRAHYSVTALAAQLAELYRAAVQSAR